MRLLAGMVAAMREMKDSGVAWIGNLPIGWDTIQIKRLFSIKSGATPKSEDERNYGGKYQWITPADYDTDDHYVSAGKRTLTDEGLASCSCELIPSGSIIFSKRAPIGLVAINTENLCTNQGCLACVPIEPATNVNYYYYTISACKEQFEALGTGTTFKEISFTKFSNSVIPRPPLKEQAKISTFLDTEAKKIKSLIVSNQKQIEKLKQYKQSLITEVVTRGLDPDIPMKDSGIEWIGNMPESWTLIPSKFLFKNCMERRREEDEQLTASQKYGMISQTEYMLKENQRVVMSYRSESSDENYGAKADLK